MELINLAESRIKRCQDSLLEATRVKHLMNLLLPEELKKLEVVSGNAYSWYENYLSINFHAPSYEENTDSEWLAYNWVRQTMLLLTECMGVEWASLPEAQTDHDIKYSGSCKAQGVTIAFTIMSAPPAPGCKIVATDVPSHYFSYTVICPEEGEDE